MQGWRNSMEDAHVMEHVTDGVSLFAVYDGHGSDLVAKFCAYYMLRELISLPHYKSKDYRKAMSHIFTHLEDCIVSPQGRDVISKVRDTSSKSKKGKGVEYAAYKDMKFNVNGTNEKASYIDLVYMGGTTAVAALVVQNNVYITNCGDSRAIVVERDKSRVHVVLSTVDHKPDNKEEKKRIENANGYVAYNRVNGNLNLSRSIGDFEYKSNRSLPRGKQQVLADSDLYEYKINEYSEFMVIACDGVWDCWTNDRVASFVWDGIKKKTPLTEIIEKMFHSICPNQTDNMMFGTDNMTCIIVQFKQS